MNKTLRLLLPLAIFLPLVLGCNDIFKKISEVGEPKIMTSTNGDVQIRVPAGWREQNDLNDKAIIQASHILRDIYVVVIDEDKENMVEGYTIDDYTDWASNDMKEVLEQPNLTPTANKTINGLEARQFEVTGSIDKTKLKYIVATVATDKSFYRVIAWGLEKDFEKYRRDFQGVVDSFRPAGTETSPAPPKITGKSDSPAR